MCAHKASAAKLHIAHTTRAPGPTRRRLISAATAYTVDVESGVGVVGKHEASGQAEVAGGWRLRETPANWVYCSQQNKVNEILAAMSFVCMFLDLQSQPCLEVPKLSIQRILSSAFVCLNTQISANFEARVIKIGMQIAVSLF